MAQVTFARKPFLRWIVVSGLLLAVPISYFVAQWTRNKFLLKLDNRARDELQINLAYLQGRMDNLQTMTRLVGSDERVLALVQRPDDPAQRDMVNQFLNRFGVIAGSIAYVLTTKGLVIASGNWQMPDSFVGQDLSFRPYFRAAVAGQPGQYVAIGSTSGKLGYFVASPIHVNDSIAGVAVTKTNPRDLILPYDRKDQAFIITDPNGVAIVSTTHVLLYHSIGPLAASTVEAMKKEQPFAGIPIEPMSTLPIEKIGRIRLITLNSKALSGFNPGSREYVLASSRIPFSQWDAHMLWPIHDLRATLVQSLLVALLVLIVTILMALFAAERWRHMKSMHEQAMRDPLTGLYTRLYMLESASSLLTAHNRGNVPGVGAIMFDLDRFKAINDLYGHSAGDNVLVAAARVILNECRGSDIPIRYGGEELLIFIPTGDSRKALQLAERIRQQIKSLDLYLNGTKVALTVSGGIAIHRPGEPLERLIDRADQMLYLAKQKGRDQVRWQDR